MQYEIPESISANQVSAAFDKVIIRRNRPERSKGGIIYTETAKQYMSDNIGVIVSIGPTADPGLAIGEIVMFAKHAGTWETLPGTDDEIFIAIDLDIIALINKE